jgi:hypothetical protein
VTNAIKEHTGSFPKTMMRDIPSVPISDFENTLNFPSEEIYLGSGPPSHLPMGNVPCLSSPSHGFLHHIIGTLNNVMRFLTSRFGILMNIEILFEKTFYFDINIGNTFWYRK